MTRLYVPNDLSLNTSFLLSENQHHYVRNVMRMAEGENLLVFNGKDGEWSARIEHITKKETQIICTEQTRSQTEENLSDIWLCFAPIKKTEFIIQKATELGVRTLVPVITERTVVHQTNMEKIKAQAIEASEQSERLSIPEIKDPIRLEALIETAPSDRAFFFLNERGQGNNLNTSLPKTAFMIGPEGGFTEKEIQKMTAAEWTSLHLGRLILRAETAALAILAYTQIDRTLKKGCKNL